MLGALPPYVIATDAVCFIALVATTVLGGVLVQNWFTYMPRYVAVIATVVYVLGCMGLLALLFSAQKIIV